MHGVMSVMVEDPPGWLTSPPPSWVWQSGQPYGVMSVSWRTPWLTDPPGGWLTPLPGMRTWWVMDGWGARPLRWLSVLVDFHDFEIFSQAAGCVGQWKEKNGYKDRCHRCWEGGGEFGPLKPLVQCDVLFRAEKTASSLFTRQKKTRLFGKACRRVSEGCCADRHPGDVVERRGGKADQFLLRHHARPVLSFLPFYQVPICVDTICQHRLVPHWNQWHACWNQGGFFASLDFGPHCSQQAEWHMWVTLRWSWSLCGIPQQRSLDADKRPCWLRTYSCRAESLSSHVQMTMQKLPGSVTKIATTITTSRTSCPSTKSTLHRWEAFKVLCWQTRKRVRRNR